MEALDPVPDRSIRHGDSPEQLPEVDIQDALAKGSTTSEALTEAALARAGAADGEGSRVFTALYAERALAAARASDTLRKAALSRSPIDGLPISIKDLFDVAGETTRAGSVALDDAPPAKVSSPVVGRLIAAGAVLVGRTNMTEILGIGLTIEGLLAAALPH